MKLTPKMTLNRKAGMTLIELTVVILVLLALIAVLFVGARAYKKGSDKAACVMNQRNIQQACRAYYNLNPNGTALTAIGDLKTAELLGDAPECPATGVAFALSNTAADTAAGTLFAPCPSLVAQPEHVPADASGW